MNLYKVILQGMTINSMGRANGISYVIANDPTEAYDKVRQYLDENDYGFEHDRQLDRVEFVAESDEYGRLPKLYL